jgi:hypothetical protein
MTTDPIGQPLGGYPGFSSAPPEAPEADPRRARPFPRAATIGGGVAAALALGLALGFVARPHLALPPTAAPMRAVTAAPQDGGQTMNIEMSAAPPTPVARPDGKLEVLAPDMARQAADAAPAPVPAPPRWAEAEAAAPIRTPQVVAGPIAPPAMAPPQFAPADPACGGARSRAAQMVCGDPELAAADREMNQAFRRALRSGAAPDQLRQDQRDWLAIREDAARRSPRAVADIYQQRIDELNQIADDGPG